MVSFLTIDVKEIECNLNRLDFPEAKIELLADLILKGEGLFRPLILKKLGIEKYLLLDGGLEYFASVRAREKNPHIGEMVNSFVVSDGDERTIQEQVEVLKSFYQTESILKINAGTSNQENQISGDSKNVDWISSFEKRLSEVREEFFQVKRDHEYRFTRLEKDARKNVDLLELINTLDQVSLVSELSRYGFAKSKAEAIYNARDKKDERKFENYQDIVKSTQGLGAGGILNLIDSWTRINK